MTLTLTVLGCGSSAGVPRPALGWGACDPNNPKNRRRRCSLLVERAGDRGVTRIVIDTSPDLREQLIDASVDHIDAVFLTHEHADQTHGIDDLRSVVMQQHGNIPALGYRIGDAAYTPDVSDIPAESWPLLKDLDLWIIDGLRYAGHPSHFSVNDALAWIDRFKPRRAIITNMHSDLDYELLRQTLPPNVVPAHDG